MVLPAKRESVAKFSFGLVGPGHCEQLSLNSGKIKPANNPLLWLFLNVLFLLNARFEIWDRTTTRKHPAKTFLNSNLSDGTNQREERKYNRILVPFQISFNKPNNNYAFLLAIVDMTAGVGVYGFDIAPEAKEQEERRWEKQKKKKKRTGEENEIKE